MSELLVLVDHADGAPRKLSLQCVTAAAALAADTGDEVGAVWLGPGGAEAAERLGGLGATRLYHWDSRDAIDYVTVPQVEALEALLDDRDVGALLFASTNHQKDVAARLAIRRSAGVITDCTDLEVEDGVIVATKEVFGGSMVTRSRVADGRLPILGVAANAFRVGEPAGPAAQVVDLAVEPSHQARAARVTEVEAQASERPDPGEAAVVVAGGRGVGEAAGFELIERLADALGGAVGVTRPVTDAGWYPHRHQIGQTGRTVSPVLYLACGISGAIEHRAGMQTSQYVVAVNTDPRAPIFDISDFGVVGDLYEVVPALLEEIRARGD